MSDPQRPAAGVNIRDYQDAAIKAARAAWSQGDRNAMIVLPTGTGKTIVGLSVVASAAAKGMRTLWLAHRQELLDQPLRSFRGLWGELGRDAGIVQADRDECRARTVFASMDTLRGETRLKRYLEGGPPTLVIVDEAHHSAAETWSRTLRALDEARVAVAGSTPYKIGLTATPDRADGKSLAKIWKLVYSYPLPRAIREGNLVPPVFEKFLLPGLNLDEVGGGEDWDSEQLGEAMEAAGAVEHTVAAIRQFAIRRRGIVFGATVKQARETAEALQKGGFQARWISGETPDDERSRLMKAFVSGAVQWLCNVDVLTEGTDLPPCDCVVMARPTRSRPRYMQALGRGLRLFPGKEDCLVLDLVGATEEHRMIVAPILLDQLEREEREVERRERGEGHGGGAKPWRRQRPPQAAWVALDRLDRQTWTVDCGEHGMVFVVEDPAGAGWNAFLVPKKKQSNGATIVPLTDAPVDFDLARGLGEDVARQAYMLTLGKAKWREKDPSPKQCAILDRYGRLDRMLGDLGLRDELHEAHVLERPERAAKLLADRGIKAGQLADAVTQEMALRTAAAKKIAVRTDKAGR
jgi:ATP-dependent helicase IRC3